MKSYIKLFKLLILAIILITFYPTLSLSSTLCPDKERNETLKDCPWADITRSISQKEDISEISNTITKSIPNLIKSTGLELWGESINFDEGAKGIIVDYKIIKALEQIFNICNTSFESKIINNKQIVHAGIIHTYGYVFSNLYTPYGYKRARWVQGEIEKGFKLVEGTFSPIPSEGNLFNNITYFIGNIVFKNDIDNLTFLKKYKNLIPSELYNYNFNSLNVKIIEETVNMPEENKTIKLYTYLVKFLEPQNNTHLLIYAVYDSLSNKTKLITTFPVNDSFVQMILNPSNFGAKVKIQTRYNAYVQGLTWSEKEVYGSKKLLN